MFSKADSFAMLFAGLTGYGDGLYKINVVSDFGGNACSYLVYDKSSRVLDVYLNRFDFSPTDLGIDGYGYGPEVSLKCVDGEFDPSLLIGLGFWSNEISEMRDVYPYLTPDSSTNRFYECVDTNYSVVIDNVGLYVRRDGETDPCMILVF